MGIPNISWLISFSLGNLFKLFSMVVLILFILSFIFRLTRHKDKAGEAAFVFLHLSTCIHACDHILLYLLVF